MELKKTFVGGLMNKDFDVRLIPEGEYIDAENIIVSNSEGSSLGVVQKSNGLDKLTNLNLPVDAITIGSVTDEGNECIYWFVTSSAGNFIYEYNVLDNQSLSIVLSDTRSSSTNILNFDPEYKITGANVIYNSFNKEKLLVWTDDLNPIRCININRAKSLPVNGFATQDISLYKRAPYEAPECTPTQFGDGTENNIKERFLSFGYRYRYLDGEYSATSAFSNPQFYPSDFSFDFSTQENNGMVNSFNAVNIKFNTGDKNVTDIQLLFKESNNGNIYVIENLNKKDEQYGNNNNKTFLFSNNKIYSILPEDEVNRLYDNIPIVAKAQEFIGNRLLFGNYVEGRELVNVNNEKINVNIQAGYTSQELTDIDLQFTLSTTTGSNDTLNIQFEPDSLKRGKIINISFRASSPTPFFGNYLADLSFYLDNDYANAYDLSISPEFINFIDSVATNHFLNFDFSNTTPIGDVATYSPYQILQSPSVNTLTIKIPYIGHTSAPEYYSIGSNSVALFLSTGNAFASCKSNRSYECGIVYLDNDGRYSTVLTSKNNTSFIPISNSKTKNQLQVKIYNDPPKWADRYKIFVKDSKLSYQTIYGVFVYKEDSFLWIRLEGQDKQKVKEGDYIIIKKSVDGIAETVEKLQILEYTTKAPDFIEGNLNAAAAKIIERGGVYIKVKSIGSLNIDGVEKQFYDLKSSASSRGDYFFLYAGPFSYKEGTVVKDIAITPGSYIDLSITNKKYGKSGGNEEFIKKYTASGSYANFQLWFQTEGNGLGKFGVTPPYEFVRGNFKKINGANIFYNDPAGFLYLKIKNILNGNGQHSSFMNSAITITTGISLLVFETDPDDNNSEVFFETQDTYLVSNGKHLSRRADNALDVDQATNIPATINLDWFNCFTQGNGAESYIIKDVFNKNFLSTNSRPNAVLLDGYKETRNIASLTYSGAFDKTTNYNSLNEFNLSRANYKDLDDKYGSIQKIHSRDTDLVVFQEDKVHRILYNKNVLFDAVGGGQVSSVEDVLGQEIPFAGEFGISKNPESFSYYANSLYFTDTNKGSVLRLGGDGLEPISKYKMRDWFKDTLRDYKNSFKYGGFDPVHDNYILSFSDDEKILEGYLTCGQTIEWLNVPANSSYVYNINLGSNIGDHVVNYTIPSGSVFDFDVNINGVVTSFTDRTGTGTLSVSKPTTGQVGVLTIHNRESRVCSLSLVNRCVTTPELEVITLVVNDDSDISKSMTNGYYWSNSATATSGQSDLLDIFKTNITRFDVDTGYEGENEIPYNNSYIKVRSNKGTGTFTSCNRIGYLVSSATLTAQQILDSAIYPVITNNGNENYIEFTFTRTAGQKLHLIWDYIDVENCDKESFPVDLCYNATSYEAACDCDVPNIDCVTSDWSDWSACVNGTSTRTKTILTEPSGTGTECPSLIDTRSCTDCVTSDWSDWSECINGVKTQTKTVITPATNGGAACPELTRTESCTMPAVDCVASDWSAWSPCVDGYKTHTKTIITPASNGGAPCPVLTETVPCSMNCVEYLITNTNDPNGQADNIYVPYVDCSGNPQEEEISAGSGRTICAQEGSYVLPEGGALSVNGPCGGNTGQPVNCVTSEWSPWSACVDGFKTHTKTIITPASNGGTACSALTETVACTPECIEYLITNTNDPNGQADNIYVPYIDCNGVAQEEEISAGSGRTICAQDGTYYLPEAGSINIVGPCGSSVPEPINCVTSDWSDWSACTDGLQTQTRTIIAQPTNGGAACPELINTRTCSSIDITDVICNSVDGSNTVTKRYRIVLSNAPSNYIIDVASLTNSSNLTYSIISTPGDCYIQIAFVPGSELSIQLILKNSTGTVVGTSGFETLYGYYQGAIPSCFPVDCVVSGWSEWSDCVDGYKTHTRTIVTQPQNGGAACLPLSETVTCPVDCVTSDWSDWSACVDGLKTHTKTVIIQPMNGGAACPVLSETVGCSTITLGSAICYTSDGSNTVTKRFRISVANEPANYTISSRNVENQGNLTWSIVPTHGDAYLQVEFKSDRTGGSEFAIELLINNSSGVTTGSSGIVAVNNQAQTYLPSCFPPPVVNCVVSDWSDWSDCVNGTHTQTRTVITPASGGGAACPTLTNTEACTPSGVRINYVVNLDGGISNGNFDLLSGSTNIFGTTYTTSGFVDVPYNSLITAIIYAPPGDTSGTVNFYTRVFAQYGGSVIADSGFPTSNSYAYISFYATSDVSIQADGSTATVGGGGGEIIQ